MISQEIRKPSQKQTITKPFKTTYIGNVEYQDYSKALEQEAKKIRIQQVRQQEAEKSRLNLLSKKDLEEQQKQQQIREEQKQRYLELLAIKNKLEEEREKQEKEIGLSHKQALEAEQQRQKEIEQKKIRQQEFKKNQAIRTQKAAEWKKKEDYEIVGKKEESNQQRRQMLQEIQQKERDEAQEYQEYLNNLPEPVQEDPLQYDAYEKNDNRKSYYNNIDFSKTHFHNPAVVKHDDEDLVENALENARKEYEKTQIKNLELMQTKKIRSQEEQERGKAALKKTQNEKVLREFSQEMDQKKAELEQERIKQTANNPNHSEKPVTHFQKDIQKKNVIEKAFEKEFFGERAEWTHEEINDKEKDLHTKKSRENSTSKPNTLKKSQSLQNTDNSVYEFEKRALQNAQKKSKNVKIFRKPPLDSNLDKQKNGKNSQNSTDKKEGDNDKQDKSKLDSKDQQSNEDGSVQQFQQSTDKKQPKMNNFMKSTNSDYNKEQFDPNVLQQSGNYDNKFRNSYDSYDMSDKKVSQITSDRKKKIRFVSPQKSNSDSDFTDEENTFGQKSDRNNRFANKPSDNNTFSPYNSNGFQDRANGDNQYGNTSNEKSTQFNKSGNNLNNTGHNNSTNLLSNRDSSLNRNDIKTYILEQEQYLKKLEDDRKKSRERIRQEENALINSLQQATNTMEHKNKENNYIQQQQLKGFNQSQSLSIPEKKAIFIEENSSQNSSQILNHNQNPYTSNNQYNNSNGQKRQVVYSNNPEKTKKANQMLDQFLNSGKAQDQSFNNYDSFNQRSVNEDYDERENLDNVEEPNINKSSFNNKNKDPHMRSGHSSSNKVNPLIKPDNFLGSSGYESQSRDFTDSKGDLTDSYNDASQSKRNYREGGNDNYYQSDFTESQLTGSMNNNNSNINQYQNNSSSKYNLQENRNKDKFLTTFSPTKQLEQQERDYNYEEEEKDYKFGNTTESKYKNDSFKKSSALSNNSNFKNNPNNISDSRKFGLSQSKGHNNNSRDLIELSESLLTSNNFNSINKNNSSHLRQNNFTSSQNFQPQSSQHHNRRSDLSPSSELSYSLSEIDRSADKVRRVEYIPQQSTTQKRNISNENNQIESNLDSQSRIGTAKFGQPLILQQQAALLHPSNSKEGKQGISMNIQFKEDEDDDENYRMTSQNRAQHTGSEGQASLADLFKKKKADLAKKYEMEQQQRVYKSEAQEPKKERTKEDILKQRKEMMKRPDFLKNKQLTSQEDSSLNDAHNSSQKGEQRGYITSFHDPSKKIKEPSQDLMDRLANGSKAKVEKKEYLKLTNKNYELLPEVKKRKEEEQKKEEFKKRQESVKKLQESIRGSQKIKKN